MAYRDYTTNSYRSTDGGSYQTSSDAQHASNVWSHNNNLNTAKPASSYSANSNYDFKISNQSMTSH